MPRSGLLLGVLVVFLLIGSGTATPDTITLNPETLSFSPTDYYIATVTDSRSNAGLGRWFTQLGQPSAPLDLDGGTAMGLRRFIHQNLRQDTRQRAVTMRLRECRITENAQGNRVSGTVAFAVTFELNRNADGEDIPVKLSDFRTLGQYTRPISQTQVVEQTIRQSVVAALRSFDGYMKKEGKADSRLATRLSLKIKDYAFNRDNDTVFYATDRPLAWTDFQAPPRSGSRFAAEINPNFAYEGRSRIVNGTVELTLTVKTFMLKSGSWVKAPALNSYSLNHEQRHFDIAKIVTERFKNKLNPDSLSIEDYNSNVQYQFLESYREMSRMQELYDTETNHGLNVSAQERWNARIDADLKIYGIR